MLITQCALAHVRQLDCALGTRIHEPVAALRVKLGSRNDFGKLLHVGWFDVHNVEALVLNVQVPEVDPQVIATDKSLAIAVDRYAVDMIGVGVGVGLARHSGDNSVVVGQSWELQVGSAPEVDIGVPDRATSASNTSSRRKFVGEIVLRYHL